MICPCHNSRYGPDGTLISGPATTSLSGYPVTYDGANLLCVTIPGLAFQVKSLSVHSVNGDTVRLALTFPTINYGTYEVHYREHTDGPRQAVAFAITPAGPPDRTTLLANGTEKTVYVDSTSATGFYSVGLKVIESN